jgi:UDP-N-acetylmuramoyl-tripeptide--D-alanyl-D-alanine ligase
MNLSLNDVRKLTNAEFFFAERLKGKKFSAVSTDSRTVEEGNVFFALRGEKFDGHSFVEQAITKKVSAVVVESQWYRQNAQLVEQSVSSAVVVPDSTKALAELAKIYRNKFSIPVLAIGGSNGKTTTKEMIGAVLKEKFHVLKTEGNLNNHIGVPQTLFKLTPRHEVAVLELGTNHFGEMKYLCDIAMPTHALITNIGKEHLEFFGDERGVAQEETELFRAVAADGFAFINNDDPLLANADKKMRRTLRYGTTRAAEIRAARIRVSESGQPLFTVIRRKQKDTMEIRLSVAGLHNVTNALAAAAVGMEFGVQKKKISQALETFTATSKRMETITRNGITILNDTYNANPDSVIAALKTLKAMKVKGKKIVVLADMLELGDKAEHEHAKIGLEVSNLDFEYLLTFGSLSRFTHEASKLAFAEHFDSKEALIASLKSQLAPGDAVLVKGSRGMKMEDVVVQL